MRSLKFSSAILFIANVKSSTPFLWQGSGFLLTNGSNEKYEKYHMKNHQAHEKGCMLRHGNVWQAMKKQKTRPKCIFFFTTQKKHGKSWRFGLLVWLTRPFQEGGRQKMGSQKRKSFPHQICQSFEQFEKGKNPILGENLQKTSENIHSATFRSKKSYGTKMIQNDPIKDKIRE